MFHTVLTKIKNKNFNVGVCTLTRSATALSLKFTSCGIPVTAVDINESLLRTLSQGGMPYLETGAELLLHKALKQNLIQFTSNEDLIKNTDVIFLCVDVTLDENILPDHSALLSGLQTLLPLIKPGQLIVIRGLVSPGTCSNIVKPLLEDSLSLTIGQDIFFAVCPERVMEGKIFEDLKKLPQIIGTAEDGSAKICEAVFHSIDIKTLLTDLTSAELSKLFSDTMRYVRFALSNEYAMLAEHYGVNLYEIITLLNFEYPKEQLAAPGPCGGPNFSKNGLLLLGNTPNPDFILNAWKLNENMPAFFMHKIKDKLFAKNKRLQDCKIGILGVAYKADIDDMRQSPAVRLFDTLKSLGARVYSYDPYCSSDGLETVLRDSDAVILMTNHNKFKEISPQETAKLIKPDCIVIDTWGLWDKTEWEQAGIDLTVFGVGVY